MNEEPLVRAREAAKVAGMSAHSLYVMARAGKVPSYSVGGKLRGVRFSISEVKAALRRSPAAELRETMKRRRPNHITPLQQHGKEV